MMNVYHLYCSPTGLLKEVITYAYRDVSWSSAEQTYLMRNDSQGSVGCLGKEFIMTTFLSV